MADNFWARLPRPFFALAPMAEVTDAAFRRLVARLGKPDVLWTEFVSADGLLGPGREVLLQDLVYDEGERPIVAQIFSAKPQSLRQAAKLVAELGFDGLDINMGCPDRAVERQGAGAALIKNHSLAQTLIQAAKTGVADSGHSIPVSVKTRVGYYEHEELETWLAALLELEPAAITLHARTRQELSLVPADWEDVKRAVAWRDRRESPTLIIGNGDVLDLADARRRATTTGVDGVMLGRAIFGRPWLFAANDQAPDLQKRCQILIEHIKLFDELLGEIKPFAVMKKHFKAYISGFAGAADWRAQLMETDSSAAAIKLIDKLAKTVLV